MTYSIKKIPPSEAEKVLGKLQPIFKEYKLQNSLFLDIFTRLISGNGTSYTNPVIAGVEDCSGNVIGAVVHTPPFKIILSYPFPEEAVEAVTQLYDNPIDAIGVQCAIETADALRDAFLELPKFQGVKVTTQHEMRLHKLAPSNLILPHGHQSGVNGCLRLATESDVELLEPWCIQFQEDCNLPLQTRFSNRGAMLVEKQQLHVWEVNGEPVSMAAVMGHDAGAPRVGWVFTPQELRGRGYASNCVAGVCLFEFEKYSWEAITLFTDLANPTSNKVYKSIGFKEVIDVVAYDFVQE